MKFKIISDFSNVITEYVKTGPKLNLYQPT